MVEHRSGGGAVSTAIRDRVSSSSTFQSGKLVIFRCSAKSLSDGKLKAPNRDEIQILSRNSADVSTLLFLVILRWHKRHLCHDRVTLLAPDRNLNLGARLVHAILDVAHRDVLLHSR